MNTNPPSLLTGSGPVAKAGVVAMTCLTVIVTPACGPAESSADSAISAATAVAPQPLASVTTEKEGVWAAPIELQEELEVIQEQIHASEGRWVALGNFQPELREMGLVPGPDDSQGPTPATAGFGDRLIEMQNTLAEFEARWIKMEAVSGERFGEAIKAVSAFAGTIDDPTTAERLLRETFSRGEALAARWSAFESMLGMVFSRDAEGQPLYKTHGGAVSGGGASQEAQLSMVLTHLSMIRSQIVLYRLQHNDQGPALHEGWAVLTGETNEKGEPVGPADQVPFGVLGPYLRNPVENALSGHSGVCRMDAIEPTAGWAIEPDSGEFYAVLPQAMIQALGLEDRLGKDFLAH